MTSAARTRYTGYRFPAEIISHAVWLYFRFPHGRGVAGRHRQPRTVRQWVRKFGQPFANQIRRRLPQIGDKWHFDEVALKIAGVNHWLWRAVDQTGIVLDVLAQRRRNKRAAKRLLRKLLKKQTRPHATSLPATARQKGRPCRHRASPAQGIEQASGEFAPADAPTRAANEFKSAGQAYRFLSAHDQINNLFYLRRDHLTAAEHRDARTQTFRVWAEISSPAVVI
jgi:putative transposase